MYFLSRTKTTSLLEMKRLKAYQFEIFFFHLQGVKILREFSGPSILGSLFIYYITYVFRSLKVSYPRLSHRQKRMRSMFLPPMTLFQWMSIIMLWHNFNHAHHEACKCFLMIVVVEVVTNNFQGTFRSKWLGSVHKVYLRWCLSIIRDIYGFTLQLSQISQNWCKLGR